MDSTEQARYICEQVNPDYSQEDLALVVAQLAADPANYERLLSVCTRGDEPHVCSHRCLPRSVKELIKLMLNSRLRPRRKLAAK